MSNVYTVAKINSYIKGLINEDFLLGDVSVSGEVSNLKYHTSGHIYFTLKDDKGALSCVMFAGNRTGLSFRMQEGMSVIVRGSIDLYVKDGKYQLYAKAVSLNGEGKLFEEFIKLKNELLESGMFDASYKQPIPKYVKKLGVVTASTGAAIQDIISISQRRNPYIEIILYPAIVQGEYAKDSIVKGIEILNETDVDVIIVGRGGGSMEDLWAFNERCVAEAVFNSRIPVISAVGHETDTTIIDYVSDLRAPTPSAAAELAVCDMNALIDDIDAYKEAFSRLLIRKLDEKRSTLKNLELMLKSRSPKSRLKDRRVELISLEEKLKSLMELKLETNKHRLSIYIEKLKGLSPLDKLNQGYSYSEISGKTLNSITKAKKDDIVNIYLKDGVLDAKVIDIIPKTLLEEN